MESMTAKDFLTLSSRDFENGAVQDEIYAALKEREKLIEEKPKVTKEEVRELSKRLRDTSRQTLYELKLMNWLESKGLEVKK